MPGIQVNAEAAADHRSHGGKMDSLIILVLERMTLKEKYNKMPEIIFCLGSHTSCNTGKMGSGEGSMSWGWGGRKWLWASCLQQPPGPGGKQGLSRGSATREAIMCNHFLRYSSN